MLGLRRDDDADALARPRLVSELDVAGGRGEQRVVAAHADIVAGMEGAAALADDDRSGQHRLPVAALHAEPLAGAVASVPAGRASLLVSHCLLLGLGLRLPGRGPPTCGCLLLDWSFLRRG